MRSDWTYWGRYVAEFSGRHNIRDRDTVEQMAAITLGMVGRRLKYADLISEPSAQAGI